MIEHEAAAIEEPEPAVVEASSLSSRRRLRIRRRPLRARADRRLDSQSPHLLSARSCLCCRLADHRGAGLAGGVERRNARARFHRTCHAEWRTEREAAARQALGLEG